MAGSHKFHDEYSTQAVQRAIISAASAGNNTIVAAVTGKKIRVLAMSLTGAGAVTFAFQSGAGGTALTGTTTLSTVPHVFNFNPVGWIETAAGVLLNLSLGGAVQVSGVINYVLVDEDGR
jgi:hypothetical protein